MMATWTLGKRLAFGFSVLVGLTLLMAVIAVYALESAVASKDRVIRFSVENLVSAERMSARVQRQVSNARGYILTGDERHAVAIQDARRDIDQLVERLQADVQSARGRELLSRILSSREAYERVVDRAIEAKRRGTPLDALVASFDEQLLPRHDALVEEVRELAELEEAMLRSETERASAEAKRSLLGVAGLGALVVVIALFLGMALTRSVGRQVGSSVQSVRSSSAELKVAATQQASGAKEQATAMSEIATTIGELLATSRQIADSAQRVVRISRETADGAEAGDGAVRGAVESAESIQRQVDVIVGHMLELGKKSQQVGSILEIINELAEQTNILAINATIEAAGAGESGRRFAVVGDEIRKLADRVGSSTKQIRTLLEEMRTAVNTTVMATEAGAKTVSTGMARFGDVAQTFAHITSRVDTSLEAAREIELSTKQQTTAVEQVNVAISNIAQTTKEAEAGATQTLQTASELASLSDGLSRLVEPPPSR